MSSRSQSACALIVAVESFAIGREWNLNGPVRDSVRLIERLSELFPDISITLLASPLEENAALIAKASDWPNVRRGNAMSSTVYDLLINQLPSVSSDFLFLFWGGHGVVNSDGHRRLFLGNSSRNNPETLDVSRLLTYLRSSAVKG